MKNFTTLCFLALILVACKEKTTKGESTDTDQEKLVITEKIAYANGLREFEEIQELNFTFNVKRNDSLIDSRSWSWKPQVDSVTYSEGGTSVAYNYKIEASDFPEIDQKFINDQYWLLFPYHLVWDKMKYEHIPEATAPISKKTLQKLIITYPENVGYTPGDVYEIYFDDDFVIREWVYRRGGSIEKASPFTWQEYKDINGMKLATRHLNKEGSFEITFTDISVE